MSLVSYRTIVRMIEATSSQGDNLERDMQSYSCFKSHRHERKYKINGRTCLLGELIVSKDYYGF